jgi:patatin-related protein
MPEAQPEQEIRFAVVLYGGVSLAIYINGVAQEMRNLVRATSGEPFSAEELKGTAPVYQRLAAILGRGEIPEALPPRGEPASPSRTRFVVDVISGTSAGGINGIFLAKSLANNRPMTSLQNLWFDEGAIEKLLNDKRSDQDTNLARPDKTESLLNSRRMYLKLLNAFDGMDGPDRSASSNDTDYPEVSLGDEIDLFATTTDIEGVPVPIQLFDNVVYERRYRNAYHLQYRKGLRNDFQPDNNPFLAFASRSTSSFPFAFEPMQLCSIDDILTHSPIYAKRAECLSDSDRWQKFYTNYLAGVASGSTAFPKRAFGDGGYLNNAPFSYAIDALVQRQSEVPVSRKLIYVEPSPDHVEEEPVKPGPPNAVENSIDALITIPGYQTIRNDLFRVLERNRTVARINKTLSEVEVEIETGTAEEPGSENSKKEIWFSEEVCLRAYYRMRSSEVTDQLAKMIARARTIDEESALFLALRSLIRAWREQRFSLPVQPGDPRGNNHSLAELTGFLASFDLPYRLRRLRFIARKLDVLYSVRSKTEENPAKLEAMATLRFGLSSLDVPAELPQGLEEIRKLIGQLYKELQHLQDDLLREPDSNSIVQKVREKEKAGETLYARAYMTSVLPPRDEIVEFLRRILSGPSETADTAQTTSFATKATKRSAAEPGDLETLCDLRARELLNNEQEVFEALQKLGNALSGQLLDLLDEAHANLDMAFTSSNAGRIAGRLYSNFDLFDSIQFPMMFGTDVVASDTVEIVRIAPEDADRLVPNLSKRRQKLKGLTVAHFGAFLDRDWRVSDLLWGRLDGAERLISSLLPYDGSEAVREQLIDEAHNAILVDFELQTKLKEMIIRQVAAQGPANKLDDESVASLLKVVVPDPVPLDRNEHIKLMQIWQDVVPKEMERKSGLQTIARSTTIIGKILESISAKQNFSTHVGWVSGVGRAFWGVIEISVPRSLFRQLGNYWQWLLLLIALILILIGAPLAPAVAGVGWSLLAFSLALYLIRSFLGNYMRGGQADLLKGLAALCVILILIAGIWQTRCWILDIKHKVGAKITEHVSRSKHM